MPDRPRRRDADQAASNSILTRTGLDLPPAAAGVLVCPECGEPLQKLAANWGCPDGHGKLVPPSILLTWLRAAARLTPPEDVRLLRRLSRAQAAKAKKQSECPDS